MPRFTVKSGVGSVRDHTVVVKTQADYLHEASMRAQERDYFKESRRNEVHRVTPNKTFNHLTSTSSAEESYETR